MMGAAHELSKGVIMYATTEKQNVMVSPASLPQEAITPRGTSAVIVTPQPELRETEQDATNVSSLKVGQKDDLKQTLIRVGRELLVEQGLSQLSLRKVAKLAGVSHTAPYRHFCDKSELLVSIALGDFELLLDELTKARKEFEGNPVFQLKAAGAAYIKMFLKHPEATELMFGGALRGATAFEDIELYSRKCLGVLEEIIADGQKHSLFDTKRPATDLAVAAWSIVHGLAMLRSGDQLTSLYSSEDEITEIGEFIAGVLLKGMSAV
jgi:AcrR family transcriptional regulator